MKKFLKFNYIIALLGVINILLFFTPCYEIKGKADDIYICWSNLFIATFGGHFNAELGFTLCNGLLVSFIFAIIAIILVTLKNKCKYAPLLAVPFFATSAVLTYASQIMMNYDNANVTMGTRFYFNVYPWTFVIASVFAALAFFALLDFIATVAKPKQQVTY